MLEKSTDDLSKKEADVIKSNIVSTDEKITEETTDAIEAEAIDEEATAGDKVDDNESEVDNSENENEEEETDEDESNEVDYDELSLEDLVASLKELVNNNPVQKIKSKVDGIKNAFNLKFGALLAEKKNAFLEEGGESIDFQFSSPIKTDYNALLSEYKTKRDAYYGNLEKQLNENLEKRLQVIEDLKTLIDEAEVSTMYKNFKVIQDTWKTIGPVPKTTYNDTWKIYHHHVERFYDLLSLSNDFRDLDFKHNLDEKLKIIERAEALIDEKDINVAAKELQELHKIWKEDIGPVSREMREELWQKFSDVTKKIHDKRHDYFKAMRSKYDDIIDKKLAIIAEIDVYDTSKNSTHNDWQKSIDEIEILRKKYFSAGKLPYAKSEEVWQKFKAATKKFNAAKNIFYKEEKSEQQENLQKKLALIEIAESIKDSDDWEMATNAMKKVQADWKKIGHVPRKFSDQIWKQFKAACNYYFNRYHQQKNAISKEQQVIVDEKNDYLESLKTQKKFTKNSVLEAINHWKELGKLPRNSRHLDGKFNKFIDKTLENLSLDKNEVSMLRFFNLVDSYVENNDFRKLDSEQLFIRKKVDEIVREIQQLENNLSFFSNANENNPLVVNVKNQVNDFKDDLEHWKEKLNYIKKLEY